MLMMVVVVMVVVVVGLEPTRATTRGRCLVGEFLVERLLLLEVLRYPARVRVRVRARVGVGVGVGVGAGVGVRVGVRVRVRGRGRVGRSSPPAASATRHPRP